MNKLIAILAMLGLLISGAVGENSGTTVIGGADGPTAIFVRDKEDAVGSVTLAFDANATTGFEWSAFIVCGDSVEIDTEGSGYVKDASASSTECGTGGTHYFKLNAVHSGETILRFSYARSWENEPLTVRYVLATVDDEQYIHTLDITDSGVYDGTVTEVNTEDHSVLLTTERFGEVVARFDADEPLPAQDEHILVYTNGTMTMSLPAIVNVMAWSAEPSEIAR